MKSLQGIAMMLFLCFGIPLDAQDTRDTRDALRDTRISLDTSYRSLGQFLDEISLQSGFDFTYDASLLSPRKQILFGARNMPLGQALDSLLMDPLIESRIVGKNIVLFRKGQRIIPLPGDSTEVSGRQVSGVVTDLKSGKALAFATIALSGTSLGTVSNEDGRFAFKLPEELNDPILVISYMGFKDYVLPLAFPLDGEVNITMEKDLIPLQEVMIRYTDPLKLLRESLRRVNENYLNENAAMTAFYREAVKRDNRYMLYFESVLDVDKSSYTRQLVRDHVKVRKGRKISDTMTGDTVIIKLRSGIFTALSLDVVKERPDFLGPELNELYQFDFTDLISYRDKLVYVITFRQREQIRDLLLQGTLYLDHESLAIVAADFEFDPIKVRKYPEVFIVNASPDIRIRPTMASYHVEYRSDQGRYYLSQVHGEVGMKVRKRRKWIGAKYGISFDLAVTHVDPGVDLEIVRSDRLRPGQVLVDEQFDFDPDFWGPYNIIEPEASLVESIRRIKHILQESEEE